VAHFYVENGVGRRVVDAINLFTTNHGCEATIQHELHPQMQLPQQGDEWWIEAATQDEYVILTGDEAIFRTPSERETVERCGARVVVFARADYTAWQCIAALSSHWSRIEQQLEVDGPWILKIYAGPTTAVLLLPEVGAADA
jgi:PIN like domain